MGKVLVTDIDGTIVHYDDRDEKNSIALKKFKGKNNLVVACTGRSLGSVAELEVEKSIKFDYYILLNGTMIADSNKNIIQHSFIKADIVKDIIRMIEHEKLNVCINDGFEYYHILGDGENMPNLHSRLGIGEIKTNEISAILVNYKKLDGMGEDILKDVVNRINNKYSDFVIAYKNNRYIDIVPVNCSKGEAVNKLEKLINISHKDIYTIGDEDNDISMIDNRYSSFTFNRSKENIKSKAKYVIEEFPECIKIIEKEK